MNNCKKTNFLVTQFVTYLDNELSHFDTFTKKQQYNFAELIIDISRSNVRSHQYDSNSFSYSAKELGTLFERSKFAFLINRTIPTMIVKTINYNPDKASTYGYKLTEEAVALVNTFLNNYPLKGYWRHNNINHTNNKFAIMSRDKNNNTAKKSFNIISTIPINQRNLAKITEIDSSNNTNKKIARLKLDAYKLIDKVDMYSKLKCNYIEVNSGRLYGTGTHLQNVSKLVRSGALDSLWDYDIANCHFSLMYQLCIKNGLELKHIKYYMNNKDKIRNRISLFTGLHVDKVKQALIALLYGAKLSPYKENQLFKLVGEDCMEFFLSNSDIDDIYEDIKIGRNELISNIKVNGSNYLNIMQKTIPKTASKSKILCHILQGHEAKILNIVGELYAVDLVLLVHDGWVSKKPLEVKLIQRNVFLRLGLHIDIEEKQINFKQEYEALIG